MITHFKIENAIKRYRHYGFQEEDLYDIVLSNK